MMSDFNPHKPSFRDWSSVQQWFILHWQFLALGISLPLLLFGILALKVGESSSGLPWDLSILFAIHSIEQPQLESLAIILTFTCTSLGIVFLATPVVLILGYQKQWRSLLYLILTLSGSGILSQSAKVFFHRIRPHLWQSSYPFPSTFSFPSGHALLSMAFVIVLILITWRTKWRGFVIGLGGLFVLGIAWTRLYLGVHFPSDILAGWFLAITWSILSSLLLNIHQFNRIVDTQSSTVLES
ncbi:Phosphoesterase PA-phosphatase related protein [Planktothrix tepida]|uniref:Phosphoesterase PA-phosphatase related protein n=2 Tax=Planktothrix TaxID=54304 RepID=A0A1J1LRD3_9CYAN|nr:MULTISPECIES: phosphatase PAP2 family protein [Planktothrix]CAD5943146.1 Phosphoesterase PA-phosphatase related protein [Planktothrix pseudagardhii]CAD5967783.1 Phosphoesterase PA-phosphatase related protein [Planktothrix tepida]CUR35152.1 Phosphoesterase PA-phosphatase related protein [Planktothrix tepida PCC 9214]